jgi:hypothetical protein
VSDLVVSRILLALAALGAVLAIALGRPGWIAFFVIVGLMVKFVLWRRRRPRR